MILWSSKLETEDTVVIPHLGRRQWRWVLSLERWSVSVERQMRLIDGDNKWLCVGFLFSLAITDHWGVGSSHMWYDGPWCMYSAGFLHLTTNYVNCDKCMPKL